MEYNASITGRIIKTERKKKGWSQDKLGDKVNISSKQISKYEKGILFPPMDTMTKLCSIFGCELGYLLGEKTYADGTRLNTAICEKMGLKAETIKAIEFITGSSRKSLDMGENAESYQEIMNTLLTSREFMNLIYNLFELKLLREKEQAIEEEFYLKYGEEIAAKAMEMHFSSVDYEHSPDDNITPEISEAYRDMSKIMDEKYNWGYQEKVLRYELSECFINLINRLFPKV